MRIIVIHKHKNGIDISLAFYMAGWQCVTRLELVGQGWMVAAASIQSKHTWKIQVKEFFFLVDDINQMIERR